MKTFPHQVWKSLAGRTLNPELSLQDGFTQLASLASEETQHD
jgi:hypothetical protein